MKNLINKKYLVSIFIIVSIILAIIGYQNEKIDNNATLYEVFDRECKLIGSYEIEKYEEILESNNNYFGYCIKDVFSSTTVLENTKDDLFTYTHINISACEISPAREVEQEILIREIFVVGHAYGMPNTEKSFFPDRLTNFLNSKKSRSLSSIALTGDFVKIANTESFMKVKKYISEGFISYFLALGNHEILHNDVNVISTFYETFDSDIFVEDFGHVIVIAANFSNDNWLPSSSQQEEINYLIGRSNANTVVILSHQLFWLKEFESEIEPNSYSLLNKELPYDSLGWIEKSKEKDIIVISGDYGAFGQPTFCKQKNNKLFIANGIGDLDSDTIIQIKVFKNSIELEEVLLKSK